MGVALQVEFVGLAVGLDVAHDEAAAATPGVHAGGAAQGGVEGGAGVVDAAVPVAGAAVARAFDGLLAEEDGAAQQADVLGLQVGQVGLGLCALQCEEGGGPAQGVLRGEEDGFFLVEVEASVEDLRAAAVVGLAQVGTAGGGDVAGGRRVEQDLVVDGLVAGGGGVAAGGSRVGVGVGVGGGEVQARERQASGFGGECDGRFDVTQDGLG